jgi:hypothetical protein
MASLDEQLRRSFVAASDFVQAPPGLADRARRASRRRRRRARVAAAACGLILVAAGASFVAVGQHQVAPAGSRYDGRVPRPGLVGMASVDQLAAHGRYVYALSSPPDRLSAFDRATGKRIRQVSVPDVPLVLAVGPGGRVWLSFGQDATGSGPQGTWLLSPDLRLRSTAPAAVDNLVPTGLTTAQAVTPRGAVKMQMPSPGQPGSATQTQIPGTGIGRGAIVIWWADRLGGRMAADVNIGGPNNGELDHLVIAGRPAIQFGGGTRFAIQSVASTGDALWAITSRYGRGAPLGWGPLIRLDGELRVTTPQSIRSSAILDEATQVWSTGSSVWVATAVTSHWLVCFTASGQPGPIIPVSVGGQIAALAVSGDAVYVSMMRPHASDVVRSYRIPAACR